ncbi:MAG: FimV/HubP family polar landmark protein, partial [Nevskia sp.]|nr:FimV/HubP family polar landmark protein [Nevskia sp.]
PPAEAAALAQQAAPAAAAEGETGVVPLTEVPASPPKPAPAAGPTEPLPPATGSGGTYGPTAPQETLWSIATKLRPGPQVSMDQVLLAIYRDNPGAFDKGRFNGLLKGQVLHVPSLADMRESTPDEAKVAVDAWRRGAHPSAARAVPKPAAAPAPKPAKPAKPAPALAAKPALPVAKPKPEPKPEPLPEPKPVQQAPSPPPPPQQVKPPEPKPEPAPVPVTPPPASPVSPPAAATEPAKPASPPAPVEPAKPAAPPAEAAAPPPPVKKKLVTAPPPPPPALWEDPTVQMGLVGAVVLGFGALGLYLMRRRKGAAPAPTAKAPAVKAPAPAKKEAAPPPPPRPPEPVAAPAAPPEVALAKTAVEETAPIKAADTPLGAPALEEEPPLARSIPAGDVDFDLTSQFEAQTLSVNLDANDPISEADFHLAYGLYDEAASLLKQALAKEPQRQDLRLKLAETYFAAGKPLEFQETAEALHGHIGAEEWQKIAIMGRQLCPDAALFKGEAAASLPSVDLAVGEPSAAKKPAGKEGTIDFDLDSELLKSVQAPPPGPAPAAKPAAAPKPDFDLSQFDMGGEPPPAAGHGGIEFNLDELDLSKPPAGVSSSDEIGTKLDLARVYADMGDNEAANGLLHEVMASGNAAQKGEAEALIKRLATT